MLTDAGYLGGYDYPANKDESAGVFENYLKVKPVSESDTKEFYAFVGQNAVSGNAAKRN